MQSTLPPTNEGISTQGKDRKGNHCKGAAIGHAAGRPRPYALTIRFPGKTQPGHKRLPKSHPGNKNIYQEETYAQVRYYCFHGILFSFLTGAQTSAPTSPNPIDYSAHVVGYAHMDMAWLWRWEESIHDVMYNTFTNQIKMMNQYPDYTFSQDQAVVLDTLEHYYPDVFKGIQEKAPHRQLHPRQIKLVQMDENVSDSESMVRQFLYGQKYSKNKFA
jgi:hypothetical protein